MGGQGWRWSRWAVLVLPKRCEVLHMPLAIFCQRGHTFSTRQQPRVSVQLHFLPAEQFWADLRLLRVAPSPALSWDGSCSLVLALLGAGELFQGQGEGEEKAECCLTPLPSSSVRHPFPSQPWELLAGRRSSSCTASSSSSPSAHFAGVYPRPAPHPALCDGAGAHRAGCSPGHIPGDLGHPQHLLPGWGGRLRSLCPGSGTYPEMLDGPCWEPQGATAPALTVNN